MTFYHNDGAILTTRARQSLPTQEHIDVHRSWARLATTEDLHAAKHEARWLLTADSEPDGYPIEVNETTRLERLAVIAAVDRELEYRGRRGLSRPYVHTGIPRELLDEIKARVPVEQEIGDSLARPLRRSGSVYLALCPFHDDHYPSLVIWPKSGQWRCYPCNVGGDVIAWTQARQRIEFREAIVYLAHRAGVTLPAELRAQAA